MSATLDEQCDEAIRSLHRDGYAMLGGEYPQEGHRNPLVAAVARACFDSVQWSSRNVSNAINVAWHYDSHDRILGPLATGDQALVVFVLAKVDFGARNGATQVVPRSHLAPKDLKQDTSGAVTLAMQRGHWAVFVGSHVLHRAGANRSRDARPARLIFAEGRWRGQ